MRPLILGSGSLCAAANLRMSCDAIKAIGIAVSQVVSGPLCSRSAAVAPTRCRTVIVPRPSTRPVKSCASFRQGGGRFNGQDALHRNQRGQSSTNEALHSMQ